MLAKAVQARRAYGAKLVIAKLGRLSRDAHFLLGLEKARVDLAVADMPNANWLTVGIMGMVAEEERRMISKRTKDALAAAKRRSTGPDLAPLIKELQAGGKTSLRAIAEGLNKQSIPTARGGKWSSPQVMRMLGRLASQLGSTEPAGYFFVGRRFTRGG